MKTSWKCAILVLLASIVGCRNADPKTTSRESETTKTQTLESISANAPAAIIPTPSTPESENAPVESEHQPSLDELLLFFPTKYPDGNWEPDNIDFEDVWIDSDDGTRIHGWYCPCEKPRAYLLYAHGNAGNLSHRTQLLRRLQTQLRVTTLIFDYRGYGRSDGMPTTSGAIADTRAASQFLAHRVGVDESQLVLMGRSLGGAMAIQVASETQPKGLVVESSFSSLKQVASLHYPKLAWLVPKNKLDSNAAIASYTGSFLQSHGTHDRTIPYKSGVELFSSANEPKSFIKIQNADHNDDLPDNYYDKLERYLGRLPPEANNSR